MEISRLKKIKKVAVVVALCLLLDVPMAVCASAKMGEQCEGFTFMQIDNSSVLVTNAKDNTSAILSLSNTSSSLRVTVKGFKKNDSGFILWDKKSSTIYSSFTGKTTSVDELKEAVEVGDLKDMKSINDSEMQSVVSSKKIKVSYKKLSRYVSSVGSIYSVAAAIIAVTAAVLSVTISTGPGAVVALIGAIFSVISWGLNHKRSDKGIYVRVDKHKIVKHQAGGTSTIYVHTIGWVGTY